jgi:hypothetical protein
MMTEKYYNQWYATHHAFHLITPPIVPVANAARRDAEQVLYIMMQMVNRFNFYMNDYIEYEKIQVEHWLYTEAKWIHEKECLYNDLHSAIHMVGKEYASLQARLKIWLRWGDEINGVATNNCLKLYSSLNAHQEAQVAKMVGFQETIAFVERLDKVMDQPPPTEQVDVSSIEMLIEDMGLQYKGAVIGKVSANELAILAATADKMLGADGADKSGTAAKAITAKAAEEKANAADEATR